MLTPGNGDFPIIGVSSLFGVLLTAVERLCVCSIAFMLKPDIDGLNFR